jgi:acyl dehydratase
MYINRETALGVQFPPLTFDMERGRLRLFAKAIGETDPIYTDVAAARAAGHPDLPVPPSFLGNSIELEIPDPLGWVAGLGGNTQGTTHAEEIFTYHKMAYAGDSLTFRRRIVDVYTKKGGQLEFVVKQTDIYRGDELIAEAQFVMALFHPEAKQ